MILLFQPILEYLLAYRYAALFVVTFFPAFGLPLPSAPSLMASAALASQGVFNIIWVVIVAALGNILGDNIMYWLARLFGTQIFNKIGLRKIVQSEIFQSLENEINKHSKIVVLLSRAQIQTTAAVNLLAGLGRMSYRTFFVYSLIGEILQVLVYAGLGYAFGRNWEVVYAIVGQFTIVIALLLSLVLLLLSRKVSHYMLDRFKK